MCIYNVRFRFGLHFSIVWGCVPPVSSKQETQSHLGDGPSFTNKSEKLTTLIDPDWSWEAGPFLWLLDQFGRFVPVGEASFKHPKKGLGQ